MKKENNNIETILKNKKYLWLVTGVAGFIGSNILEKLLLLDQKVVGIDNLSTGFKENLKSVNKIVGNKRWKNFKFFKGDLSSLKNCLERLKRLPIGGTAVGTGINAHKLFTKEFLIALNSGNKYKYVDKKNKFEGLSSQDDAVLYSSHLKSIAVSLIKISNDLRWMNSGPGSGISDITLKALQPGSSIMPGKVNPVIPESSIMACSQVIGNDTTIMICGQSGNFQLNVTLPIIAYNIIQSTNIIANTSVSLAKKSINNFEVNNSIIQKSVNSNPILVTALNRIIGYEKGAYIAKKAYKLGIPIIDVALEETNLSEKDLKKILDPLALTKGGIK